MNAEARFTTRFLIWTGFALGVVVGATANVSLGIQFAIIFVPIVLIFLLAILEIRQENNDY